MLILPRSRTLTSHLACLAHLAVHVVSDPVILDGGVATKYFKPDLAPSDIESGMFKGSRIMSVCLVILGDHCKGVTAPTEDLKAARLFVNVTSPAVQRRLPLAPVAMKSVMVHVCRCSYGQIRFFRICSSYMERLSFRNTSQMVRAGRLALGL